MACRGFVQVVPLGPSAPVSADLGDLLDRAVGVQVRRYGGLGAVTLASVRRSSPSQVQVTIDYEMVDLSYEPSSPLGISPDPSTGQFVGSCRYVMLQTYTIQNMTASPIFDLELYQMLHGHLAGTDGTLVTSVYDSDLYPDLLAVYVPFNPVHTVGNFCYDITQWNTLPGDDADHREEGNISD